MSLEFKCGIRLQMKKPFPKSNNKYDRAAGTIPERTRVYEPVADEAEGKTKTSKRQEK